MIPPHGCIGSDVSKNGFAHWTAGAGELAHDQGMTHDRLMAYV
jgi:hypothetical protein